MEHYILALVGLDGALSVLRAIIYFIITIFILVTIHEFGHFIAGRIFGMRVPVFSVGIGRRLFGFNKINGLTVGPLAPEAELQLGDHTDYRLSLLPIGGYAKIEGMIDETQNESLPDEIKPWEFRAKPWWQKSIVICAGVIMNTLLAWLIFSGHDYAIGEDLHMTTTVGYVESGSLSHQLGVKPNDRVTAIDGKPVASWEDVERGAILEHIGRDFPMTLEHDGKPYTVNYQTGKIALPEDLSKAFGLTPAGYNLAKVAEVPKATGGPSPAEKAGLKVGDVITQVNSDSIPNYFALIDRISSNASKPITLVWVRAGSPMSAVVTPDATGKIGVQLENPDYNGPKKHENYSMGQALGTGWHEMMTGVSLTFKMLGLVITGKTPVSKALAGPVKIAQIASRSAASGLESFIMFMGLLSMALALTNILPIPALDGGHLIIILIEAAIGHELSQRFKLGFQKVGIAILLSLMVFMVFNDIRTL